MGNIMTSMWTGVSGLKTNQSSLNTAGHNLANINTEGYVRQQIVTKDTIYNSIGTSHISELQVGYGTNIQEIRQVRDVFLDKAYRMEVGRQGFYEAQSEATQEIEAVLGELEGEAFHQDITYFWNTLQELAKEPDSIVKRAAVLSEASTLLERAQSIYDAFGKYQKNLNTQVQDKVNRVNQIGQQIKELNDKIVRYECASENANDLRDSRNQLLDELGKIVKISYSEDYMGNVDVSIEGRQFVWDRSVYGLTTKTVEDSSSLLEVVWDDGQNTPLYDLTQECRSDNNSNIGSLKGILIARGNTSANYTDIPVRENFNSDADFDDAVKKYNAEVNSSVIRNTMAQFDQLIHGIVTAINDVLCPNVSFDTYKTGMGINGNGFTVTGSDGTEIDMSKVKVWDEANAPVGMDPNHTPRQELFERKYTDRYMEADLSYVDANGDPQTRKIYIYNEENPANVYSLYSIDSIQINDEMQKEVSLFPLSSTSLSGGTAQFAFGKCQQLVDVFNIKGHTLSPNQLTKYTFADYYTAFVGEVGTKGNMFESMAAEQQTVASNIDNQRSTVLGVSSEEELTNIIRFQYAYGASSKYINVINDMLETIINSMG
ncbi:flagellar hook-associated protein FlgK [[Clostridium] polysaccharolyticum]|uniref:Flagellar hook-associated protein 1 n=1 Tax=[Clostridium] polysaccharolyticum TaxID=29364 RepID=A0A1I0CV29_9FIRM|nr:flagellar hook-associated protein FlgK [[Clostridium] polysaccharolyticum]SET23156.1 flagellar hook-associated protein 1 FlgK [[Clostridium] polysaccharolyticum]